MKHIENILLVLLIPIFSIGQSQKVKISGEYSYTYGDSESLAEAKEMCYSMALRNAIETYQIFIASTTTVQDHQVIKDLIRTLSMGHVQDINVLKEEINGRKIYYKIEGYVNPIDIENLLSEELNKVEGKEEFEPLMENAFIKILSVKDERDEKGNLKFIWITYRQKKRGGIWYDHNDTYINIEKAYSVIVIDYFDEHGEPILSKEVKTKRNLRAKHFDKITVGGSGSELPADATSYKLWFLED